MTTTYKLNTMELETSFIDTIKTTYPNQVVEIEVREQDETEFLMSNPVVTNDQIIISSCKNHR